MAQHQICSSCGTSNIPERTTCKRCGTPLYEAFINNDYLQLRELSYLVAETSSWPDCDGLHEPYQQRLYTLKQRAFPQLLQAVALPATVPVPTTTPSLPVALPGATTPMPISVPQPSTSPDAVPFEQWLLSERNIKFALYAGGLLVLLAGLVFVGINWNYLPGLVKFGLAVLATSLLFVGGFLLYRREAMQLSGITLLGVGAGFVPLSFTVLQTYVTASLVSTTQMWLLALYQRERLIAARKILAQQWRTWGA